ncbi:MAG TPA: DUF1203 domain-containing protein [Acetobacteraceae bacterium]|nr:DUF1203 domain-containing protein [Acetobacteraceae bacterium]
MRFRITGLSAQPFQPLFGLSEAELSKYGVKRLVADEKPGFPCRIEMRDADVGETLLLLNHIYQPADTPYRGTHAIFVREGATDTYNAVDQVPEVMRVRLLSLRGFDAAGMMLDADVVEGVHIEPLIERMFSNPDISYIHVHNAKRGCYSGRIDRA